MQEFKIPWGQWYEQSTRTLSFPDDWDVRFCGMKEAPSIDSDAIEKKIDSPIESDTIEKLAAGKKNACIVIDDISRPTPGALILPIIIRKLVAAGLSYSDIKVLIALGGHRPMTRQEMRIKVGDWVLNHVQVLNHSPFADDLVTFPDDSQIIKINRKFVESELRISVGCIVPHIMAGFSGGAKAVIPGMGGIETLHSNHSLVFEDKESTMAYKTNTCNPDNPMRKNMERIVGKVGLHFIVNAVLNQNMEVAEVFAGHFIKAHREACKCARELLSTKLVKNADINVLSAFPKDTEYQQIGTAFALLGQYKKECAAKGGTLVAMTAASEGTGFHNLFGPGMDLFSPHDDNVPPIELKGYETLIYSDGVTSLDIQQWWREKAPEVYQNWDQILEKLKIKYEGKKPLVAIYPMGAIQIGYL